MANNLEGGGKTPVLPPEELEELEQQVDSECNVQGGLGRARLQDTLGYQLLMMPLSLYRVIAGFMPHAF